MITLDQNGDGPALVLLHGVGADRTVWREVMPRLAARYRVLAPDLPGFGRSDPAGRGFDLGATADALAPLLEERSGGPFALLGSSLGGAVAIALAERHPALVQSLVLAAPAGFTPQPWPVAAAAGRLIEPLMRVRRVLGTPLADRPLARRGLFWGAVAEPDRLSADDARLMLDCSRGAKRIGAAVSTVLRADLADTLAGLHQPLGVIWGRRDGAIPIAILERIRQARPDAAVETIPGAGHVPQLERPPAFAAAVERLLDRLGN